MGARNPQALQQDQRQDCFAAAMERLRPLSGTSQWCGVLDSYEACALMDAGATLCSSSAREMRHAAQMGQANKSFVYVWPDDTLLYCLHVVRLADQA